MNREPIYVALYERLQNIEGVVLTSRRPRLAANVPIEQQPAIFLEQSESNATGEPGMPSRIAIQASILVYVYADTDVGPYPKLNEIVTAIEENLRAQSGESPRSPGATTLGGKVFSARATSVKTFGEKLGAQGIAVLDVELLTAN